MTGKADTGGLCAVVVTFDRLDQVRLTIGRLLQSAEVANVIVIDNGSTDGTADWLAQQDDPRLMVVTEPVNRGGAGGFAEGLRIARDRTRAEWVVLLDDDARPAPGALTAFSRRIRDTYDAWLAAVWLPDGEICDMNRPWINPLWAPRVLWRSLWRGRAGFHLNDAAYESETVKPVHGGSFVGLFLSRELLETGALPDPRLFLYGDDVLFTLGLTRDGARIGFDPTLRFEHDCRTLAEDRLAPTPVWKTYYLTRNRLLVFRRVVGPVLFWPVAGIMILRWTWIGHRLGRTNPAWRRLFRAGLADGLRGRLDRDHSTILALAGSE